MPKKSGRQGPYGRNGRGTSHNSTLSFDRWFGRQRSRRRKLSKKRFEKKSSGLEVITDGYGGVVDFNAAKGTIQYEASEKFGGKHIDWEFELATDTEIAWDDSTSLLPKIARTAEDGPEDSDKPIFGISIEKATAGPFRAGDRVRLKASIDDFSRFRKDYFRAFGLVAIYYLEEGPNPVFDLRLDRAEVTLIKGANQDAGKTEPAKPEGSPEKGAGENRRDELEQLLEDAEERQLTYSPDKKLLAHLGQRVVTVWSVEERRQMHRFVLQGRSLAVAFSPDGGSLVTADGEGNLETRSTIKLWSLATGEGRLIARFMGYTTHFSFSPDGSRLAATSNFHLKGLVPKKSENKNAPAPMQTGGSIHVWRVSDGDELLKVDIELPEYTAKLREEIVPVMAKLSRQPSWDPHGSEAIAMGKAMTDAYMKAIRKRVPHRLNFSPDGQRLIAVSKSGQETIFDSRTGKLLRPTSGGEQDGDDHPATALESKSEGKQKPDPESKGRSQ